MQSKSKRNVTPILGSHGSHIFGACVNLLYYWGMLQLLIKAFGRVMHVVMKIGPIEAFCAAANVFLGPVST